MYDFLVFIGRFQPFHLGHKAVIDQALKQAKRVIVLVGSAKGPRTLRNPFTFEERSSMILRSYRDDPNFSQNIHIIPLLDRLYADQKWIESVQMSVNGIVCQYHVGVNKPKIGLIGMEKDHTSYYLKMFPQWSSVGVEDYKAMNATDIRNFYFDDPRKSTPWQFLLGLHDILLPNSSLSILKEFEKTGEFSILIDENKFIQKHKEKRTRHDGYPVIDHTVDAVVVQSGHILLVKRKAQPGKGLLALPGGYIQEHEKLKDAMLRELREETCISIDDKILSRNIKSTKTFDDPNRSSRGRIITTAFLIELEGKKHLPIVKGADDAEAASWVPLAELDPEKLFEDHFAVIMSMIDSL